MSHGFGVRDRTPSSLKIGVGALTGGYMGPIQVYQHVPDGWQTANGLDFSRLLGDLGAPERNTSRDVPCRPWLTVGTLPPAFLGF